MLFKERRGYTYMLEIVDEAAWFTPGMIVKFWLAS